MKEIYKNLLFNHGLLVSERKGALDEAFAARYVMDRAFSIRINNGKNLVTEEMVPYIAKMLGENVPEPFYKGFPDSVKALSADELLFDQLLHYTRTYGMGDFSEPGYSCLEEYIERKAFNEKCDSKDFDVITEVEAVTQVAEYCESLLSSTRPINDDQYVFICEYISDYDYTIKECASKNLAIKLLLQFRDVRYARFISMSDVIKLVDELNYTAYGNDNLKKLNLKNADRKFITSVINELFHSDSCNIRDCYEKKAVWNGLLHHIHYQPIDEVSAQFVQSMRGKSNFSVYSEFEFALAQRDIEAAVTALKKGKGSGAILRNLNYIISRCSSDDEVEKVVSQISASNGLVLLQLLMEYASYDENNDKRTFVFSKHNKLIVHAETDAEVARRKSAINVDMAKKLCDLVKTKLQEHYNSALGKVFIDEGMKKIALPLQENTSTSGYGILSKGSRIHIEEGKKIRAFTYWEKVNDIDLSVIGIKEDGSQVEFSWRTMYNSQSDAIVYSGDETSGYNGGSEYFDVDVEKFKTLYPNVTHLVFCDNVFSNASFKQCTCRAGYMLRDTMDSGEIYEPKTVKSSFTVDCDSTFAYLFAIDLSKNDFIWLNTMRDSNVHVAGATSLGFITRYFDVTDVINVYDLFSMLASEVVTDINEAEIVVSDENLSQLDGVEYIRSYDIERIISLMNS